MATVLLVEVHTEFIQLVVTCGIVNDKLKDIQDLSSYLCQSATKLSPLSIYDFFLSSKDLLFHVSLSISPLSAFFGFS